VAQAPASAPTATATDGKSAGGKSVAARLIGVVMSPRAAYADVAARPRVLGALAVVILISAAAVYIFMSTEVGRQAGLDMQIRQMEAFGRTVNDAQYQQMERMAGYSPYFGAAGQLVSLPLMALIVAGIAFAVFNAALGGDATFKQVYAVVVHSGAIILVQQLFTLPLDYVRETLSSPTNLAVFLPFLDENSFPARLLGSIDLFVIWWSISLAIGLGVLYRKRTGPIATTLLVIYVTIGLVIAAVKTALAGA
jgi:Yip1-like protein